MLLTQIQGGYQVIQTAGRQRDPFLLEREGSFISQKEYRECLVQCRLDNSKFGDMQQSLSGKIVFYKLASEFELLFDFKATCAEVLKT